MRYRTITNGKLEAISTASQVLTKLRKAVKKLVLTSDPNSVPAKVRGQQSVPEKVRGQRMQTQDSV